MKNLKQIAIGAIALPLMIATALLLISGIGKGLIIAFGYFGVYPTGLSLLRIFDITPPNWMEATDIGVGMLIVALFVAFIWLTLSGLLSGFGKWILDAVSPKK